MSLPLTVVTAESVTEKSIHLTVDAVIVGSGASGAVMAFELAKQGKSVVMIEAGRYVPSTEFNERLAEMFGKLFQDKGAQANTDGDFLILQGRCLGGSTVVNGAVCFRMPDDVLEEWHRDHGLTTYTRERLSRAYEKVEKRLSVHVNLPHEINANSRILERGCTSLGWSHRPLSRNTKDCALTGFCVQGCATDRKQSMLVTYVPWALEKGARVFVDSTVEQILTDGGRATGVLATMRRPDTGETVSNLRIDAARVILAAGTVQTPILLMKSGLCGSSGQVGKNFALHPSTVTTALFDEEVFGYRGATLGSYCDEFESLSKGGFILEGGTTGADALCSLSPGIGAPHIAFMERYKHLACMASLVHDRNNGWIEWDGERKKIHYTLHEDDKPKVRAALKASARIFFAAGATECYLPTYAPTIIRSLEAVDPAIDALTLEPQSLLYFSYHPQGTCRMGTDPQTSVTSPTGETHEVKGLYIVDASVFPTSILVNPQMTVYALATLIAEQMLAA